ncbi:acylneuraminate cytidylyltransferase family protein [Candidatus Woesearchaeota archaeon]|jgi:CMP-N,N'-diacetyllegionaminic acid synthase|nr:acylneuraminate cytidylyltransferase family protein [Candidatus Woesearchaeota archaeon]MBT6045178.1 acylneuraminate cytidylyltransferase family protein [Candidatus Woesearchaeota archaeon]
MTEENGLVIAIIPARGGSKTVLKKNVKDMCGKPMIAYSIEAAKNSPKVDKVFVSTDSEEIAEVSRKFGAEIVYEKEENMDQFDLYKESYLDYAVQEIEKTGIKIRLIAFLQCTSIFRDNKEIDEAIAMIDEQEYDSAITAFPSFRYYGQLKDGCYVPFRKVRERKQAMEPWYCDNGALYVIKRDLFDQVKNRYGGRIGLVMMEEVNSLEIDYPYDWWLAEQLMTRRKEGKTRMDF